MNNRKTITINAQDVRLGQLATAIAQELMGKKEATFEYYKDEGANIIVFNTNKLSLHPNKLSTKLYHRHTGYPGGIRTEAADKLLARDSQEMLRKAVFGMLPKNRLRPLMLRRLVMYKGEIK